MKWFKRKYSNSIIALLTIMFGASCGNNKKDVVPAKINAYEVMALKPHLVTTQTDYPAAIQGVQNIEIRPKINGYLEKILIDEGQLVKKGQLLFIISAPHYEQDIATAKANIKIATAEVNAARMQVNKVRPLVEQDIVSTYQLEAAKYTLQSKEAALAQANTALNNAKIDVGYTHIYSPANGVVGILPNKIGSLVDSSAGNPLTTVSNIENIYAYFSINEKQGLDFFTSSPGKTMQDKLATLPAVTLILANNYELPQKGKIETASGIINAQTGAVNLRAVFSNSDGLVRSGSSALVRIPQYLKNVLTVPQKASYQIQGKIFVYKVDKTNKVSSVELTIAGSSGQDYIVKKGLNAGDLIVTDGISSLRDGMEIKPQQSAQTNASN